MLIPAAEASLPPVTGPLPAWAKVLVWLVGTAASSGLYKDFEQGLPMYPAPTLEADPVADEWRRFSVIWDDTASLDNADRQVFSLDVVNITNGVIDSSWTTADYNGVYGQIVNFLTEVALHTPGHFHCATIQAHRMAFQPYTFTKTLPSGEVIYPPFVPTGPPEFSANPNKTGGGTGYAAAQSCTTITKVTPSRRNWGRAFMPTLTSSAYAANGRVITTAVDGLATAFEAMVTGLAAAEFQLVVPTTSVNGLRTRTLQGVIEIRVDDVPDVHRSRRLHKTSYRKVLP